MNQKTKEREYERRQKEHKREKKYTVEGTKYEGRRKRKAGHYRQNYNETREERRKGKAKREKCPTNDDKEKENIATLFFASFLHVRGFLNDFAPKYQKVLPFSQFLYGHTM
jgi:hypothetical protein